MICRLIPPDWLKQQGYKVLEGEFTYDQLVNHNTQGYNIYYFPNCPSGGYPGVSINSSHIDRFCFVFVDYDLKQEVYKDKEHFIETLLTSGLPEPTSIVDSGHGIHAYWQVSDLDASSYLSLQRRLMRLLKTDEAVSKICQLMRLPGTINTKNPDEFILCEELSKNNNVYTSEDLDKVLPVLTEVDRQYVESSLQKLNPNLGNSYTSISDQIPLKFAQLVKNNKEVKEIWSGGVDDRSRADYRLAHIMYSNGFTKDEAITVLANSAKAISRSPVHRLSYATNIVDKITLFENSEESGQQKSQLSMSVTDILQKNKGVESGTRFPCNSIVDGTHSGFRLGQVFGLVGGSGVGKTTFALNLFKWFVENNPEYVHFFVSLEQPIEEISDRWALMCGSNTQLHDKVQVLGNYNENGTYRNLSLSDIKEYILEFELSHKVKVGAVVLDHIGILKKSTANGENQGLTEICQSLKSFAIETKTFFVVQSQTNREKAGIGDLELNKDAAFGTTAFEWYCDFLVTIWAPLKRVYDLAPNMTVTAFKFCKIRKKNINKDRIKEDQRYILMFDTNTEHYRLLTQNEMKSFSFFNSQATELRKKDRKTDILEYKSVDWSNYDQKDITGA